MYPPVFTYLNVKPPFLGFLNFLSSSLWCMTSSKEVKAKASFLSSRYLKMANNILFSPKTVKIVFSDVEFWHKNLKFYLKSETFSFRFYTLCQWLLKALSEGFDHVIITRLYFPTINSRVSDKSVFWRCSWWEQLTAQTTIKIIVTENQSCLFCLLGLQTQSKCENAVSLLGNSFLPCLPYPNVGN